MGIALLAALLVVLVSPDLPTVSYVGKCLLMLGLVLGAGRGLLTVRRLSVPIRAEMGLLAISVALSLVAGELGLRLFASHRFPDLHPKNLHYCYDTTLGWFPTPNSRTPFSHQRTVSLVTNNKGFRGREFVRDGRPGVMVLGDSFVWGYDVETSDRFTEKLQGKHPEWNIFNLGVCGYSTDQEYLLLQRHFDELRPRLVVLIFCAENDEASNCQNFNTAYAKPYFIEESNRLVLKGVPVPTTERVFCSMHPILSRAHLIRLLVQARDRMCLPERRQVPSPTLAILKAIQRYLVERQASFVVGFTARVPNLEPLLEAEGIPYIDLSTSYRFAEGDHWTPQGHEFVCARLEEAILAGRLLETTTRQ
jgi:hypothetical protein